MFTLYANALIIIIGYLFVKLYYVIAFHHLILYCMVYIIHLYSLLVIVGAASLILLNTTQHRYLKVISNVLFCINYLYEWYGEDLSHRDPMTTDSTSTIQDC